MQKNEKIALIIFLLGFILLFFLFILKSPEELTLEKSILANQNELYYFNGIITSVKELNDSTLIGIEVTIKYSFFLPENQDYYNLEKGDKLEIEASIEEQDKDKKYNNLNIHEIRTI